MGSPLPTSYLSLVCLDVKDSAHASPTKTEEEEFPEPVLAVGAVEAAALPPRLFLLCLFPAARP